MGDTSRSDVSVWAKLVTVSPRKSRALIALKQDAERNRLQDVAKSEYPIFKVDMIANPTGLVNKKTAKAILP